eukprot:1190255-Prorocentrum_minimum.AAC.1
MREHRMGESPRMPERRIQGPGRRIQGSGRRIQGAHQHVAGELAVALQCAGMVEDFLPLFRQRRLHRRAVPLELAPLRLRPRQVQLHARLRLCPAVAQPRHSPPHGPRGTVGGSDSRRQSAIVGDSRRYRRRVTVGDSRQQFNGRGQAAVGAPLDLTALALAGEGRPLLPQRRRRRLVLRPRLSQLAALLSQNLRLGLQQPLALRAVPDPTEGRGRLVIAEQNLGKFGRVTKTPAGLSNDYQTRESSCGTLRKGVPKTVQDLSNDRRLPTTVRGRPSGVERGDSGVTEGLETRRARCQPPIDKRSSDRAAPSRLRRVSTCRRLRSQAAEATVEGLQRLPRGHKESKKSRRSLGGVYVESTIPLKYACY